MEYQIVEYIVLGALSLVVWFMKRTLDQLETKQTKQDSETQRIKEEYLHKSDFREFKSELRSMFEEIRTDIRDLKK